MNLRPYNAAQLYLKGSAGIVNSPMLPLIGMVGLIVARALGWIQMNDALARGLIFIPLFTMVRRCRLTSG